MKTENPGMMQRALKTISAIRPTAPVLVRGTARDTFELVARVPPARGTLPRENLGYIAAECLIEAGRGQVQIPIDCLGALPLRQYASPRLLTHNAGFTVDGAIVHSAPCEERDGAQPWEHPFFGEPGDWTDPVVFQADTIKRFTAAVKACQSYKWSTIGLNDNIELRADKGELSLCVTDSVKLFLHRARTAVQLPGVGGQVIIGGTQWLAMAAAVRASGAGGAEAVEFNKIKDSTDSCRFRWKADGVFYTYQFGERDTTFPNWRTILPKTQENRAEFKAEDLLRTVKALKAREASNSAAAEKAEKAYEKGRKAGEKKIDGGRYTEPAPARYTAGLELQVQTDPPRITVQLSGDDTFPAQPPVEVAQASRNGKKHDFRFKPQVLIDVLSTFSGPVRLGYSKDSYPFCLETPEDSAFLAVFMPLTRY